MSLTNYSPAIDPRDLEDRVELTPAKETIKTLQKLSIPVILCTSKTASEVRVIRNQLNLTESIMEIHTQGMEDSNLQKMIDKSTTGSYADNYDHMSSAYRDMITELPKEYHFGIISSLGNSVSNALALRAYEKYNYTSTKASFQSKAVMPEWLKDLAIRTQNQIAMTGVLYRVHQDLWSTACWKGSPQYFDWMIRSAVIRKCQQQAEFRDNNNRNRKQDTTVSDWSDAMDVMDC